jgi:hypothetical protein
MLTTYNRNRFVPSEANFNNVSIVIEYRVEEVTSILVAS